jgi:hypothetical protein
MRKDRSTLLADLSARQHRGMRYFCNDLTMLCRERMPAKWTVRNVVGALNRAAKNLKAWGEAL